MVEEKVIELLDQLAVKLGVASGKIWEWALIDVKVSIIEDILFIVGFLVFCFIQYKLWRKYSKKIKEKFQEEYYWMCILILVLIVINFFCFLLTIGCIMELPSLIINPEWNALQNIIRQLKIL